MLVLTGLVHFDGMDGEGPARLSGDMFGMKKESDGVGWAIPSHRHYLPCYCLFIFYPRAVPQGGQNAI